MGAESERFGSLLASLQALEQRIQEQEQREAKVRQALARLVSGFEAAPFAACVLDPVRSPEGAVTGFTLADANLQVLNWLGRSKESLIGQNPFTALPAGVCPAPEHWTALVTAGGREEAECRVPGAVGTTWFFRHTIALPDGLLVFWRDISAQKRVENELRDREERFRRVIQVLPCLVIALDANRNILVWNQACERATGYTAEEVVLNPNALELFYPDPEKRQRIVDEWKVRGKNYDGWEWTIRAKDGREVTLDLYSNHGRYPIPGWASWAVGLDVTERHRAEEEERLHIEARLQQAQKMESIGLLAGGIAHDFNNLLSPIMGFAELAIAEADAHADSARSEGLRQIVKAAERGMDLTRRLLAFSRKQVLDMRPLDLNAEVTQAVDLLGRLIGEDVAVTLHLDPELWQIRGDSAQLQQVLMNLAINARDAMPEGGTLIIETANVNLMEHLVRGVPGLRPGRHAMLTVSDTGEGMDERVRNRIFEPFFTTKGPGRGTGLGLAIVTGIVQQHGGYLEVDSQPGLGTTFKLYFPMLERSDAPEPARPAPELPVDGRETVLVAEDEPAVRQMACRVLETHGYTVIEAPDGPTAESLFKSQEHPVDLLLTDMMMPEMNGMELYRRLSSVRSDLKVLFMTGYAADLLRRYGQEVAAIPILSKPFTIAHLTQKVREVLDAKR